MCERRVRLYTWVGYRESVCRSCGESEGTAWQFSEWYFAIGKEAEGGNRERKKMLTSLVNRQTRKKGTPYGASDYRGAACWFVFAKQGRFFFLFNDRECIRPRHFNLSMPLFQRSRFRKDKSEWQLARVSIIENE